MSDFELYLRTGLEHILDLQGYDHILFVIGLCALYRWSQWKKVVMLVTAFTIGHCLTLALSTLRFLNIPADLIEFLIPLTILFTCVVNLYVTLSAKSESGVRENVEHRAMWQRYALAAGFGLIHGLGFSNFLKSLLGQEESIVFPLFAFNVGLEIGQLFIVAVTLSLSSVFTSLLRTPNKAWNALVSGAVAMIAISLIIN